MSGACSEIDDPGLLPVDPLRAVEWQDPISDKVEGEGEANEASRNMCEEILESPWNMNKLLPKPAAMAVFIEVAAASAGRRCVCKVSIFRLGEKKINESWYDKMFEPRMISVMCFTETDGSFIKEVHICFDIQ